MKHSLACSVLLVGCGTVTSPPPIDGPTIPPPGGARCDATKPFSAPALLANVNTPDAETAFALTGDELTAFVTVETNDILVASQRTTTSAAFGAPGAGPLATLNGEVGSEYEPSPIASGLVLYFVRLDASSGTLRPFVSERLGAASAFSPGLPLVMAGSELTGTQELVIARDEQTLYWVDTNDSMLYAATRDGDREAFTNPRPASTIPVQDIVLSADELAMYYTEGSTDILVATRASRTAMFGTGVPVANVNSPQADAPVFVTADQCVMYLKSTRTGGPGDYDIWEARRPR